MRVLIVSKILVVAAYRRKLDEIAAQPGIDQLVAVTGPEWKEPDGRRIAFERSPPSADYELRIEPMRFNGNYHLFYWPHLGRLLREFRPDVVHIDEEPYNLATFTATRQARHVGARSLFFTWQNLLRRYPPPFSLFEKYVFKSSALSIAGSHEAMRVLLAKGYCGPGRVIPQFGIDPDLFSPGSTTNGPPVIGFVARLVEEKGLFVLLDALAGLDGNWRAHIIGSGPIETRARSRAAGLGLDARLTWERSVASTRIPDRMRSFTVLVQPSLTRTHWKEQFGRTLIEAMACGVPVIGSSSGEIPNVIGDAGMVVPEADPGSLRSAIARLVGDAQLRHDLARRGRERVLACFTHRRIAEQTVEAYRAAVGMNSGATIT